MIAELISRDLSMKEAGLMALYMLAEAKHTPMVAEKNHRFSAWETEAAGTYFLPTQTILRYGS
jgi:hypothetical protein